MNRDDGPAVVKVVVAVTSLDTGGITLQPAVIEVARHVMSFALVVASLLTCRVPLAIPVVSLAPARTSHMLAFVWLLTAAKRGP